VNSQFDVTITGTNGPVAPGNTLDVTVDVTNNGTDPDTQTVALDIDNGVGQVDSTSVTLSGGGSATITLSWAVPSAQTEQDYQATVSSPDDTASQTVTVSSVTIPSSVVHQYRAEDFASPWPDNVGSADMSVTGLSSSTFSNGKTSVASDGVDDSGTANGPEDLPENQSFGLAFTFSSTDDTDNTNWIGSGSSGAAFEVSDTDFFDGATGQLLFTVTDNNTNRLQVETDNSYTDGNTHLVVINKSGNNAADIDIYVDDMTTPASTTIRNDNDFNHSDYSTSQDMAFHGENKSGVGSHKAFDSGIFEFNTDTYSQSERTDLKTRRPEV